MKCANFYDDIKIIYAYKGKFVKKEFIFKSLLTGLIYAITTIIIQVSFANFLSSILNLQPEAALSDQTVILLLISIFIVGIAMAIFYYITGSIFKSKNKWIKGIKFALFIYFSNYIPQVFFIDANKGFLSFINGGFPIVQVEIYDFLILLITALLMVTYMPHKDVFKEKENRVNCMWWKLILCGLVFSTTLIATHEILLPLIGIANISEGLNVS